MRRTSSEKADTYPTPLQQGLIYSFGEEGMQLVQPSKFFSVTIFRTRSIGSIGTRANWGYVAIFSNAEKFRRLYSHYGRCMPSSPKEYSAPKLDMELRVFLPFLCV